jgi:hypothetical protein
VTNNEAAERRREHDRRLKPAQRLTERLPERLGMAWVLKHQRALEITGTVQAGRKAEMTLEQRTRRAEECENV